MELRHIAGLVCSTLDLALTPVTIKSDADFVQALERNMIEVAVENDVEENQQRRIIHTDVGDLNAGGLNVGREEKVLTTDPSEPSTSRSASVMSASSILDEIGPLRASTPKKQSNRGRK